MLDNIAFFIFSCFHIVTLQNCLLENCLLENCLLENCLLENCSPKLF